ncbi:MAG: hypothetical protein D6820_09525 [Lentisphaerae bacterium]|nr:MAG: hypothetical protein D6820_09525 [Lentisphaerota bacterium]
MKDALYETAVPRQKPLFPGHMLWYWLGAFLTGVLLGVLTYFGLMKYRQWKQMVRDSEQLEAAAEMVSTVIFNNPYLGCLQTLGFSHEFLVNTLCANRIDDPGTLQLLEKIRRQYGASIVYLMNPTGTVVVSTRYDNGKSLTGNNYAFRPYFRKAMKGEICVYGAVGVTTFKRGIYYSAPVINKQGGIEGVVVMKQGVEQLERLLHHLAGEDLRIAILTGQNHIFASNYPPWETQRPFSEKLLTLVVFPGVPDESANWEPLVLDGGIFRVGYQKLPIGDEKGDWHLAYCRPVEYRLSSALLVPAITVGGFPLILCLLLHLLAQRRELGIQKYLFQTRYLQYLKEEQKKRDDVLEKLNVSYCIVDQQQNILDINTNFTHHFPDAARRIAKSEVQLSTLLHASSQREWKRFWNDFLNSDQQCTMGEFDFGSGDETSTFRCFLYRQKHSLSEHFYLFLDDISEWKLREKLLLAQRDVFEKLISDFPVAIVEVDSACRILKANTCATDLLGKSFSDEERFEFFELLPLAEDQLRLRQQMASLQKTGMNRFDLLLKKRDTGERVQVDVQLLAPREQSGMIRYYFLIMNPKRKSLPSAAPEISVQRQIVDALLEAFPLIRDIIEWNRQSLESIVSLHSDGVKLEDHEVQAWISQIGNDMRSSLELFDLLEEIRHTMLCDKQCSFFRLRSMLLEAKPQRCDNISFDAVNGSCEIHEDREQCRLFFNLLFLLVNSLIDDQRTPLPTIKVATPETNSTRQTQLVIEYIGRPLKFDRLAQRTRQSPNLFVKDSHMPNFTKLYVLLIQAILPLYRMSFLCNTQDGELHQKIIIEF